MRSLIPPLLIVASAFGPHVASSNGDEGLRFVVTEVVTPGAISFSRENNGGGGAT